ncbi:hypothetical protein GSF22_24355, partial [Micromonospora echinofusca]|nr:hypothetical protein [Micromonospora echinofusca]
MTSEGSGPDRTGGTVYGASGPSRVRARLPQDRLLAGALGVGALGVLLGVLFASGVLAGGDAPAGKVPAAAPATADAPPTEAASPAEPTADAEPTAIEATPSVPPTSAAPPAGPRPVRSVATPLCLDVRADTDPEGADALVVPCTGAPTQQW